MRASPRCAAGNHQEPAGLPALPGRGMATRLSSWVRAFASALAVATASVASGCGVQSPLDPHSEPARRIETLWWWMLAAAALVFIGAVSLLALAWRRRNTEGLPLFGSSERASTGLVVAFGIVIPLIALSVLFAVANLSVARDTDAPERGSTKLTIEVTGHQWFWEVRYPGTAAVTANEIHIPARTRVNLVAKTDDVIHSFWVPRLNRKIDMVPGHPNRILLYADEPGRYRGQCAEFCGLQHAHMGSYVFADPPDRFRRWLRNESKPARGGGPGARLFTSACGNCHTI